MTSPTKGAADAAADAFMSTFDRLKAAPDDTGDKFDKAIWALRGIGILTLPAGGGSSLALAQLLKSKKTEVIEHLNNGIEKMTELAEGIAAPATFVSRAADWRAAAADVVNAKNAHSDTGVSIDWQGRAARAYDEARGDQETAISSAGDLAVSIAEGLEGMATEGLSLYTDVATGVLELVEKVAEAAAAIPTKGPFAASEAAAAAAGILTAMITIAGRVTANIQLQTIDAGKFKAATIAQDGMKGDGGTWPQSTSGDYADATVKDGTNSWSILK